MEASFAVLGARDGVITGPSLPLKAQSTSLNALPCSSRHTSFNWQNHHPTTPRLLADACVTRDFSHVCRTSGQESTGQSLPNDDADNSNCSGKDVGGASDSSDWRAFRARLVAGEQAVGPNQEVVPSITGTLGKSWSHPLHAPETGCLLIATEKLDGQVPFERSVIMLLGVGSDKPRDGPFGLILNRPILHAINKVNPTNQDMDDILSKCQLFYGGPLESNMLLWMCDVSAQKGLVEVMPGIYYGYSDELEQAGDDESFRGQDCRFYVGYAGWDYSQLIDEVKDGFWYVAACSPDLIKETPCDSLWQEVLLSMGGPYAELSKKPKEDGF